MKSSTKTGHRLKSNFPGVRFRLHKSRKHGVGLDRYFFIRYKVKGKDGKIRDREEGLGWASEGMTAKKASDKLSELRENKRVGNGPVTLAEKREAEEQRRLAEQANHERLQKENITFGSFMTDTYLPQCQRDKKNKTYLNEEGLYRLHLADTIGDLPFSKISAFHLERIKKDMSERGLSNRTIQYILQLIRQAFHTARTLGIYTGESPTRSVRWPKLDNMKLRYLSIDEAEKLLTALAAKSQNIHDEALLSLHCGLRFGEIAALTWSCLNLEQGTLAILNAKTGSRTAYLTDRAKAMLESRKQGRPDELIFPKRTKKKDGTMAQSSKTFSRVVDDLKLNKGVTDRKQRITFHTLRHSFATLLYESTHDLYLTQRSLGHATGTMTARYAKMSESRLREGAAALEKAFSINGSKKKDQNGQVINLKK